MKITHHYTFNLNLDSLKSPIFLNKINHQLNIPLQSLHLKSIIFMLACFLDGDVIFSFMWCNSILLLLLLLSLLFSFVLHFTNTPYKPPFRLVPYFCRPQNQSPIKHSISISIIWNPLFSYFLSCFCSLKMLISLSFNLIIIIINGMFF
jgi:hypothetical protein